MLGWIDTHCHINYQPLVDNIDQVLTRARHANVLKYVCIGTKLGTAPSMIEFANKIENCFYTIGHHPCEADLKAESVYEKLDALLACGSEKLVGIGETGLDCNNHDLASQKEIFAAHLELSVKYNLPVAVHSREMDEE